MALPHRRRRYLNWLCGRLATSYWFISSVIRMATETDRTFALTEALFHFACHAVRESGTQRQVDLQTKFFPSLRTQATGKV
jgi:hypothetical protein